MMKMKLIGRRHGKGKSRLIALKRNFVKPRPDDEPQFTITFIDPPEGIEWGYTEESIAKIRNALRCHRTCLAMGFRSKGCE